MFCLIGFKDQNYDIIKKFPAEVKVIMQLATMSADSLMKVTTNNFMRNPIWIRVKKQELTLESIKQFCLLLTIY